MNAYNYDSQLHIKNNHPKHSWLHAYTHNNEYLGLTSELTMASQDKLETGTYDPETGTLTQYGVNGGIIASYENVYAQNRVILGMIRKS